MVPQPLPRPLRDNGHISLSLSPSLDDELPRDRNYLIHFSPHNTKHQQNKKFILKSDTNKSQKLNGHAPFWLLEKLQEYKVISVLS